MNGILLIEILSFTWFVTFLAAAHPRVPTLESLAVSITTFLLILVLLL